MQHLKLTQFPAPRRHPSRGLHHQRGMTLIEWMVSITIGLILLTGMAALIAQQSKTQAELEKSSRQIENGRYAMQLLNEDIQLAGYYGEFSDMAGLPVPPLDSGNPTKLPNPCSVKLIDADPNNVLEKALSVPIQGFDSPATTAGLLSCIDNANHVPGTDILVVRRVEPATLTIAQAASAAGGQVYLQSGLTTSGQVFDKKMGVGTDAAGTTVFTLLTQAKPATATALAVPAASALLRKFLVHIYFVSPCSVMSGSTCSSAADGGNPIPTLKRLELSASGNTTAMTTTPLVEGIENMQIDYGFDTTGVAADGAPDSYAKDAATVADWANVMAVRVHLLARNNERSGGFQDTKTYNLGLEGATTATNDAFKRRVFSQLIRVVNSSARRDQ